jgi:hypothetical protein
MSQSQKKSEGESIVRTGIQIKSMGNIIQEVNTEGRGDDIKCRTCGKTKSIDQYYKRENKKPEVHCRNCRNIKREKLHRKYKQKFIYKLGEYLNVKCQRCGYDRNFSALDFHHKGKKTMSIAREIRNLTQGSFKEGGKVEKILNEILNHCEILCSNCHREHHTKHFMKIKK